MTRRTTTRARDGTRGARRARRGWRSAGRTSNTRAALGPVRREVALQEVRVGERATARVAPMVEPAGIARVGTAPRSEPRNPGHPRVCPRARARWAAGDGVGECHTLERLARVTPTRVVSKGGIASPRVSETTPFRGRGGSENPGTTDRATRPPDGRLLRRGAMPNRPTPCPRADAQTRVARTPPPSRGRCRGHPPARCRRGEWREARVKNARQRGKCTHPQKASKPIAFVGRSQPSTPSPRAATARRHCETRARSDRPGTYSQSDHERFHRLRGRCPGAAKVLSARRATATRVAWRLSASRRAVARPSPSPPRLSLRRGQEGAHSPRTDASRASSVTHRWRMVVASLSPSSRAIQTHHSKSTPT